MGILRLFKKKEKEEKKEEVELKELPKIIEGLEKNLKISEEEVFEEIREKVKFFLKEAEEKIEALNSVNIDLKKENARTKNIVKDSRKVYVRMVRNYFYKMNNLKYNNLEEVFDKMNALFEEFDKSSRSSYAKTTYLIGKEMVSLRNLLKDFSKELIKILNENGDLSKKSKKVKKLKEQQIKLQSLDLEIEESKKAITSIKEKILKLKKEESKTTKELSDFKKTKEYEKVKKSREELRYKEEVLKLLQVKLWGEIDFKALGNFFHYDATKMGKIREYKENLSIYFKKESGEEMLKLLKEAGIYKEEIGEKVKKIKEGQKELKELKEIVKKDKSSKYERELSSISAELKNLSLELKKQQSRLELLISQKKESNKQIARSAESLNLFVKDIPTF